jgi:adenosylmethionine-8-amino-7-oxononanoate aminotransferase
MVGIELVRDKVTKEPYPLQAKIGHRVAAAARQRGLLLRPLGNVLVLLPPLSTSQDVLKRMVDILRDSIETLPAH